MDDRDTRGSSLLDLFRLDVDMQTRTLAAKLLLLEQNPRASLHLEALMRAAHSIKGAGRLVGVEPAVRLAHVMEDCFVAAQRGQIIISPAHVDVLLKAVDHLIHVAYLSEGALATWNDTQEAQLCEIMGAVEMITASAVDGGVVGAPQAEAPPAPMATAAPTADRALRVTAERLDRLTGLASEIVVESRWVQPYGQMMLRLKQRQIELIHILDQLREAVGDGQLGERVTQHLHDARDKAAACREYLLERLVDLDQYDRRNSSLAIQLHREAVSTRMRPFADGVQGLPRMVRDLARSLDKWARLDIQGLATQVDRDVLTDIEAPLNHLLRNAVDHGVETPAERRQAGKPEQALIKLSAGHQAGMLAVTVEDDGRGIDIEYLRRIVTERRLAPTQIAAKLTEAELLEFLFLPNFSTRSEVTELSGRGVGLDVVRDTVQALGGSVHVSSQLGKGTRFYLQLPLTTSVLSVLLVEIAQAPFALSLARIDRILKLPYDQLHVIGGHQYATLDGEHVGLVSAAQVLELGQGQGNADNLLSIVVLSNRQHRYGVVVDGLLGQRDLAVQPLDARFGKVRDVVSAALMEDGSPVLILDVDDLLRSVDKLVGDGRLQQVHGPAAGSKLGAKRKRILVVDDSITVRELEKQILQARGYQVDVAVDGMDGWNALRSQGYDLVISDVDMPRMDGIELLRMIRADPGLRSKPVIIVSYKDRPEDRQRGLEAGADYYLTKGSFHDQRLADAVIDLIGEALS